MCSGPESALESLWQNQTDLGFQWPHARQRDRSPRLLVLETHRRPSSQSQEHREPHPQDAGVPGTDPPTPHLGDPGGSCLSAEHGAGVEMEVSLEIGTTVSSAADPQLLLTPRNLVNEFRSQWPPGLQRPDPEQPNANPPRWNSPSPEASKSPTNYVLRTTSRSRHKWKRERNPTCEKQERKQQKLTQRTQIPEKSDAIKRLCFY